MTGLLRQNQIAKIAGQMPGAVGAQVGQAGAQQTTNLQQSIAAAGQVPTQAAGQAMGAQQAQAAGQVQAAGQQQIDESALQAGKATLQQSEQEAQQRLQRKALEAQKENRVATEALGNLSSELKGQLFDSNLQFQKDEMGRTLYNDQQLLDYKLAQGLSDEQLFGYEQQVRQTSQRKLNLLKTASSKLRQELEQSFQSGQQELDQEQQRYLIERKRQIEEKIRKEKAKQKNRAAAFAAAGTIVGAVAGALIAGPGGYAAGASAGASLGSAAGNLAASS